MLILGVCLIVVEFKGWSCTVSPYCLSLTPVSSAALAESWDRTISHLACKAVRSASVLACSQIEGLIILVGTGPLNIWLNFSFRWMCYRPAFSGVLFPLQSFFTECNEFWTIIQRLPWALQNIKASQITLSCHNWIKDMALKHSRNLQNGDFEEMRKISVSWSCIPDSSYCA